MQPRCQITGIMADATQMLRFVISPDGELTPDLGHKLPGAGMWIAPERELVRALAGACDAHAPVDLADRVERLMRRRVRDILGLARKAGEIVLGFTKVEAGLKKGNIVLLLAASDGAKHGRQALAQKARMRDEAGNGTRDGAGNVEICALLSANELGMAFGRPNVIHAGTVSEYWAARIRDETMRLERYLSTPGADRSGSE